MYIKIPGNPIAKKRPRFARRGKFVTTYSDQQTEEGKALAIIMGQVEGRLRGPVSVSFVFQLQRPKGHYGSGKNSGKLKESAPKHPISKPDIDNYVKFYMDVLNDCAWVDDCQVFQLSAVKLYSDNCEPLTSIVITELP